MSRHAYFFNVDEREEQCHAGVWKHRDGMIHVDRCKNTGSVQLEGRTYCHTHIGLFVAFGRMQTYDGHEIYDVSRSQTEAPDGYEADDYGMEGKTDE